MGFEYSFKIGGEDHKRLGQAPGPIASLDHLLRAAPEFAGAQGAHYHYTPEPDNDELWPATVSVEDDGLLVCLYDRSADSHGRALLNFLIFSLLDLCGRVELEEA